MFTKLRYPGVYCIACCPFPKVILLVTVYVLPAKLSLVIAGVRTGPVTYKLLAIVVPCANVALERVLRPNIRASWPRCAR